MLRRFKLLVATTVALSSISQALGSLPWSDGAAHAARNPASDSRAILSAALNHLRAARPQEALNLLTPLLNAERARNGENTPTFVIALGLQGSAQSKLGRYDEAAPALTSALSGMERLFGPDQPVIAAVLDDLMTVYGMTGRCQQGEAAGVRAIAVFEKAHGAMSTETARALHANAVLRLRCGQYAEAERFEKRSLGIIERLVGPRDERFADGIENLGLIYSNWSRFAEAEPYLKEALELNEALSGLESQRVAGSLATLGRMYLRLRRFSEALPLFQRALSINEKLYGRGTAIVARAQKDLAETLSFAGEGKNAEPLFRSALSVTERISGANSLPVAEVLEQMALNYHNLGRSLDAETAALRALRIQEATRGPDHPRLYASLSALGVLYQETGRLDRAQEVYRRVLALLQSNSDTRGIDFITTLRNLTEAYIAQGKIKEALETSLRGVAVVTERLASETARANDVLTFDMAVRVLDRAAESKIIGREVDAEIFEIAQWASNSAAASALGQLEARFATGSDSLARLVREQQDAANEYRQADLDVRVELAKPAAQRNRSVEVAARERLSRVDERLKQLNERLRIEFPDFAALARPRPAKVAELQQLLSSDEAMVLIYPTRYGGTLVAAMTRDEFAWQGVALGGKALSDRVAAFRRGLDVDMMLDDAELKAAGKIRELFDVGGAYELYRTLFSELEPLIRDKRHLLVVPAGPLTAIPFQLLITSAPPAAEGMDRYRRADWLLKRHAVTILPSASSLRALRSYSGTIASRPMVGFGDPVFRPDSPGAQTRAARKREVVTAYSDFWKGAGVDREKLAAALPQLPDTADELNAVALKLGVQSEDIFLGQRATETAVKRASLENYRIVYFATHGLVAGDIKDIAEPSLAFSIPSQASAVDDGLLTASEIAQLKLNADWVVLSACNTIAGGAPGAEALSGLARAFLYSGARALLVSHWAVDSAATTRLATATFDRLVANSKLDRATALQHSMLEYLNDASDPKNAYPAYWGAFVIVGEGAAH